MSRPDLFDSHQEKVKAELAFCIRAAREGRAAAAANARAVAAAARNFPSVFPNGFPSLPPGFPLIRPPSLDGNLMGGGLTNIGIGGAGVPPVGTGLDFGVTNGMMPHQHTAMSPSQGLRVGF